MLTYTKNKKIKIKEISKKTYFDFKNNKRIRTDKLGALIWQSCNNSSLNQVKSRIGKKLNCPEDLLKYYMYLLDIAGVINKSHEANKNPPQNKKENSFYDDLVSLIIINFNGEKFIVDCLNSIRTQTHKNKEVVLWDNNSTDNSLKIINKSYPDVKVLASKKNILFAKAVNLSFKKCSGDYFIILNPDTVLDKDFISELLRKAKQKKEAAAIAPKMLFFSLPTCINSIGNYVPPHGWGSDNFIGHFDFGQFDNLKEVPSACFGAVMLKREALKDIGPIDNHYGAYYEDTDWSYRARLKGWKITPAPHAIIYHKFEGSFKDFPEFKSKLVVRNRLRFAIKIFSFYYVRGFLKNYFKEDIRNSLCSLLNFKLRVFLIYLWSYFSLFAQLPELLVSRIKTQKSRSKKITDKNILDLAPYYPPLLDETSSPILSVESIRNIYCLELFK